ncbi:hypothetical protein [Halothece sp. PCC 7418]|uniref:hypothetical protein n=1 Tax=Halothece sp. (strain PCC 7418) TaxID=65093 RepID=UPI0037C17805
MKETLQATHNTIGVDVGLKEFYTDSKGNKESNPRYYRKSEPKLKKINAEFLEKTVPSPKQRKILMSWKTCVCWHSARTSRDRNNWSYG